MTPIEKLISIAEQEVGYCEKSKVAVQQNSSVLDDKLTGAGADNYTKYSRDLLKWVGAPYSQGTAWCDMWCDWIFIMAFGVKSAKEMIGGWSAYTPTSAQYYKNMGRWYGSPQIGDQIFFKNDTRICHTGIVYKVDRTHVYTIEGNTSTNIGVVTNGGCVAKKTYALTYTRIAGYGRPRYEIIKPTTERKFLYKGIDVSSAQVTMDYAALKKAGVEFAIIKIIRRDLNPDTMFEKHYAGFISAGIPVLAVYNYSYATTVTKARTDAQIVVRTLAGRKVAVCLDVEDNIQKGLGKTLIDIINAYQEVIEDSGLPFILYTGMAFYNQYIKLWEKDLRCKNIWMARYYKGNNLMPFSVNPDQTKKPNPNLVGWQYTSKGKVDGYNGNLDLDIIYRDIDPVRPTVKHNIITKVKTSGARLNVRSSPVNGPIVERLQNGSIVDVLNVKNGWCLIGEQRYVSGNYIKSNTIGIVTANKLNIRDMDSTNGSIVGLYQKADTVEIYRQSKTGWYLTPKGWISNNYVKLS